MLVIYLPSWIRALQRMREGKRQGETKLHRETLLAPAPSPSPLPVSVFDELCGAILYSSPSSEQPDRLFTKIHFGPILHFNKPGAGWLFR